MSVEVRNAIPFGKTVVSGISEKNVPFMAASIAYQAFISLIPLLVLVFFLVTIVGDEGLAAEVSAATAGFLPESGQLMIEDAIEESPATAGSTLIGVVVLLWGSLKIFRGLDTAFSEIYDTAAESSFVDQLRDALIALGAIGIALVAAATASIVLAFFPDIPYLSLVSPVLLVAGLTIAFFPMYYFFPDADVSARAVLPGVLVAAVGWTALQSLFQVYVSFAADSESAGPVGAILLLLTWLYFGALVLLAGAVVNAVRSGRLEPEESDSLESMRASDRDPFADRNRRKRAQLRERIDSLERERDQLRNDLEAQRRRRYRLEDRTDRLDATIRDLESENERLERELEARTGPEWPRPVRKVLSRVSRFRLGVIKRQ
ncbi:YihY/virulence factor BrkB family protein [Natrarchaeobius chitinivorans]|uniref:YihY family inner membrane protein n=1 Tax=Natrarchaeobius chitinivorans TaxID=1679083 RepID=A0A3N6PHS4_NATCH|nr:YihY/virulence factor BrkB family protein [Natrarchaeobius chitinivorans]RQG97685.1 YihY family inner membrane protein [Natrarchaeobius chitinivorans]